MNWEELEALYWRFDAMHKGYGEWGGTSTSERDAFKRTVKQALAKKDREIAHLKEKVAHYDRWLSKGVYFTNEEFFEKILKPKQQLMEQMVRFAKAYRNEHLSNWIELVSEEMAEEMAAKDPVYVEAKAFLKEREGA